MGLNFAVCYIFKKHVIDTHKNVNQNSMKFKILYGFYTKSCSWFEVLFSRMNCKNKTTVLKTKIKTAYRTISIHSRSIKGIIKVAMEHINFFFTWCEIVNLWLAWKLLGLHAMIASFERCNIQNYQNTAMP